MFVSVIKKITTAASAQTTGYQRPVDWLPLPTVNATDQKVCILKAVFNNNANFASIKAIGAYTVDWGDGTVENVASNTQRDHQYNYASISSSTLCSRGYKQVIITITPQNGQTLTVINLNVKNATSGLQMYESGYLDLKMAAPNLTGMTLGMNTPVIYNNLIEQFNQLGTNSVITGFGYLFNGCISLQNIVNLYTNNITSMYGQFENCYSLQNVPAINTSSCTIFDSMFRGCNSLSSIPVIDTSHGTSFNNTFYSCLSLQSIPALNMSSVVSGQLSSTFNNCPSLSSFNATGIAQTFTFTNCCFSYQDLNTIFSNLGTVTGKTITIIAGNYGFYAGKQSCTGNTHSNTTIDNLSINTNTLSVGDTVAGTNIPAITTISAINSSSSITISGAGASDTATGKALTFGCNPKIATDKGWTVA